jgi:hypothetical protein
MATKTLINHAILNVQGTSNPKVEVRGDDFTFSFKGTLNTLADKVLANLQAIPNSFYTHSVSCDNADGPSPYNYSGSSNYMFE